MFGDHGLGSLLEEGAHGKSPKCLGGDLGDFGEFCKGLRQNILPVLCSHPTVKQALPPTLSRRHRYLIRYRATIRSRWFSHGFARPRV